MQKKKQILPVILHLNKILKILIILSLSLFIGSIIIQKIRSFDIWWHLKTGEYIINNGFIPQFDIFSYTVFTHTWINHQWLADVLFFLVFDCFGINGLILLKAIVLGATFTILFKITYQKRIYLLSIFFIFLAILASGHRFLMRPFIFNFLFIIIYFYILHGYKHSQQKKLIFLLPILQIIWSNLHGGSLTGIILIYAYLAGELISWKFKLPFQQNEKYTIKGKKYYILLAVGGLCLFSGLVNPNGLTGALYPFLTLTELNQSGYQEVIMKYIAELQPPISLHTLFKIQPYPYYKLLILLSLGTFILNYKRLNVTRFITYTIFLIFSLLANRNIPTFVLLATPISIFNLNHIDIRKVIILSPKIKQLLLLLSQISILIIIVTCIIKATAPQYLFRNKIIRNFGFGIIHPKYPESAIDFIQSNNISGNFFNTYESGGYLIWRMFPQEKVFIDGRTEVYGPQFYQRYVRLFANPDKFNAISDEFNINLILLTRIYTATDPFLNYIYQNKQWKLIYFDEISALFIKNSPDNQKIIKKYSSLSELLNNTPKQEVRNGIFPFTIFKKGEFLRIIGLYDEAISEFQKALKASVQTSLIHNSIGITYHQQGLYSQAESEFIKALKFSSNYAEAHNNLGSVYARKNIPDKAISEFKKAISINPEYINARLNLATTYQKINNHKQAANQYKKALSLNSDSQEARGKLALILYQQGKLNESLKQFKEILNINPHSSFALNNLGVIYNAMGKKELAIESWIKTLQVDSNHRKATLNLDKINK